MPKRSLSEKNMRNNDDDDDDDDDDNDDNANITLDKSVWKVIIIKNDGTIVL